MSLRNILASEGLTAATFLSPQEFLQKLKDGFTAAKTARIYSDFLNGEHADAYLIAGQHYKVLRSDQSYPVTGRGPWAGIPSMLAVHGKFMIVATPWMADSLNRSQAEGEPVDGWTLQKGKWVFVTEKTPIGQHIIQITNAKKGPSVAWQKAVYEGR